MTTITALHVQCIVRQDSSNILSPITRLGGPGWSYSVLEVIALIRSGVMFYTEANGSRAYLEIVYDAYGRPHYVRTRPDAISWNNLEYLPPCY